MSFCEHCLFDFEQDTIINVEIHRAAIVLYGLNASEIIDFQDTNIEFIFMEGTNKKAHILSLYLSMINTPIFKVELSTLTTLSERFNKNIQIILKQLIYYYTFT